jgi:hypothetical protein
MSITRASPAGDRRRNCSPPTRHSFETLCEQCRRQALCGTLENCNNFFFIWREKKSMFDWFPQFDRFALSPVDVPAAEKTQSEFHKLYYGTTGTLVHKWRHYLKIYEDHLSRFQNTPGSPL